MVTGLAEVYRLGTEKAAENLAFRRYLAEHHDTGKPFQILASEVQQHIDCTACANCCRHSIVAVSEEEIEAIASHLEMTAEEVTRLYTTPDTEQPGRTILGSTAEGCVFLHRNLCLIYEARPKACREFPHVGEGMHTLGSRAASHGRWAALCPIIFNALEEQKRMMGFRMEGKAS